MSNRVQIRYTGTEATIASELARASGVADRIEPGQILTLPAAIAEDAIATNANLELVRERKQRKPRAKRANPPAAPAEPEEGAPDA